MKRYHSCASHEATIEIDPLAFARVAPIPFAPGHTLRLHKLPKGEVPGVLPRLIDITSMLDDACPGDEMVDIPRRVDFPPTRR